MHLLCLLMAHQMVLLHLLLMIKYILSTSWQTVYTSAQEVELSAVYEVCLKCNSQPFNLFTDSKYIAHALQYIETVPFISTVNSNIQQLL